MDCIYIGELSTESGEIPLWGKRPDTCNPSTDLSQESNNFTSPRTRECHKMRLNGHFLRISVAYIQEKSAM